MLDIFQEAERLAKRAGHELVGTGHLLAAIAKQPGPLQSTLETYGLGHNRVLACLYRILPPYAGSIEDNTPLPCSPNLLHMQKALQFVQGIGFDENILVLVWLLGLPEGTTARALFKKLGVDREKLMDALHNVSGIKVQETKTMQTDNERYRQMMDTMKPGYVISFDTNQKLEDAEIEKIRGEFERMYCGAPPEDSIKRLSPTRIDPLPDPEIIQQAALLLRSLASELPGLRYRKAAYYIQKYSFTKEKEEKYLSSIRDGSLKEAEQIRKVADALCGTLQQAINLMERYDAITPKEKAEALKIEPLAFSITSDGFIEACKLADEQRAKDWGGLGDFVLGVYGVPKTYFEEVQEDHKKHPKALGWLNDAVTNQTILKFVVGVSVEKSPSLKAESGRLAIKLPVSKELFNYDGSGLHGILLGDVHNYIRCAIRARYGRTHAWQVTFIRSLSKECPNFSLAEVKKEFGEQVGWECCREDLSFVRETPRQPSAVEKSYLQSDELKPLATWLTERIRELGHPNTDDTWVDFLHQARLQVLESGSLCIWKVKSNGGKITEVWVVPSKRVAVMREGCDIWYRINGYDKGTCVRLERDALVTMLRAGNGQIYIDYGTGPCMVYAEFDRLPSSEEKTKLLENAINESQLTKDEIEKRVDKPLTKDAEETIANAKAVETECPEGHHKLEGECHFDYCRCSCSRCVAQCEKHGR